MITPHDDELRARFHARITRRRWRIAIGLLILAAGYALLAVSPDTQSDWVLFRAFAGFVLLFVGFGVAVMPLISKLTGTHD